MSTLFKYTDSDGETLEILDEDGAPLIFQSTDGGEWGSSAAVYIDREQAIKIRDVLDEFIGEGEEPDPEPEAAAFAPASLSGGSIYISGLPTTTWANPSPIQPDPIRVRSLPDLVNEIARRVNGAAA